MVCDRPRKRISFAISEISSKTFFYFDSDHIIKHLFKRRSITDAGQRELMHEQIRLSHAGRSTAALPTKPTRPGVPRPQTARALGARRRGSRHQPLAAFTLPPPSKKPEGFSENVSPGFESPVSHQRSNVQSKNNLIPRKSC